MTDQRFAVVIGVDDSGVDVTLPALRYAARDAQALRDVLCDPEIGMFEPSDVTLFAGPGSTAAEIKAALRRIVLQSGRGDVLVVYFAGRTLTPAWSHGTDAYLVTPELDENALVDDPDAGLRMAFLTRDVLQLFAGTALLIMDCCRSGRPSAASGGIDLVTFAGRDEPRWSALLSCAADGPHREEPALGHGRLTGLLLQALRGQAADQHGWVTFRSMTEFVRDHAGELQPGVVTQSWGGSTVLTRPGPEVAGVGRHLALPIPDTVEVVPLSSPLDRHATAIARLIDRLARNARDPVPPASGEGPVASRVEYLRSAVGAESAALLSYTSAGFTTIDATSRFDRDDVLPLIRTGGAVPFPLDPVWFGHVTRDRSHTLLLAPVNRAEDKVLLLVVVNPPTLLADLGQPMAKVLETVWRADFAASPAEAEIQVLTALRETFGRLPTLLYERCLALYREVLESFSIVFQPVITIGPAQQQVGVHSYEALARRSLSDNRAPIAMLQVAHVWGDRFVVERDRVILRKALAAYARAHAEGPWDVPKPVSVNVSVRSLLSDTYIATVHEAIAAADLDASAVTLEISEQDPIEPRAGEQWLDEPHAYFHRRLATVANEIGVAFAVDDFGAGYASLSRMAELPLTQIKVDRAVLHHPQAIKELELVVAVARSAIERGETHAPRVVIVEGVDDESPLTLRQIFDRRIKHVQGYITREPAAPTLRRLPTEVRQQIAARVRGDDENRPTTLTRQTRGEEQALRRGA